MTLLLVDGTNIVMRYASAMLPDITAEDDPNVIGKVMDAVTRAIGQCAEVAHAAHLIVAVDSSVGSWRRELYPEYKIRRTTVTHAWSNRLSIHLSQRGVFVTREPGFEADDILATLAMRATMAGKQVAILSGDSDLLQLASLQVYVYQFGKQPVEPRFVNRPMTWIREKYGIASVGHLAAYKALVGEPGDGLPGVPGIGPVKAKKLLAKYSLSSLASAPEIDAPAFKLALRLVTLREDVPIAPIAPSACRIPQAMRP